MDGDRTAYALYLVLFLVLVASSQAAACRLARR